MNRLLQARILGQVQHNLVGLQRDIAMNKAAHLAMLGAGSPPLATVRTFVNDCVAEYDRRLKWVEAWLEDEAQRDVIDNALEVAGFTEADIREQTAELRVQVDAMKAGLKRSNFVAAIEAITMEMPPSLWPE